MAPTCIVIATIIITNIVVDISIIVIIVIVIIIARIMLVTQRGGVLLNCHHQNHQKPKLRCFLNSVFIYFIIIILPFCCVCDNRNKKYIKHGDLINQSQKDHNPDGDDPDRVMVALYRLLGCGCSTDITAPDHILLLLIIVNHMNHMNHEPHDKPHPPHIVIVSSIIIITCYYHC